MKKIVSIGLLFYFLIPQLSAQFNNLRFGIQLSPTISSIESEDNLINSNGSNVGLKFGTILEWYLSPNISMNTGLNFSFNEGGKLRYDFGGDLLAGNDLSSENLHELPDGINIRYNIKYIEVPFHLKLRTNEKNQLRYYAALPIINFAFRTKARANLQGGDIDIKEENINNAVSFINISYGLGGGVEYSLNEDLSLQVGLHWMQSFFDVISNNGLQRINEGGSISIKNEDSLARLSSINLRIAILF